MRSVAVRAESGRELLDALDDAGAIELVLEGAPAELFREEILVAAARRLWPLVVSFEGTIATPLVELAAFSHLARHTAEARLDLRGALLTPLARRIGIRSLTKLVLAHGSLLPAAAVLTPERHRERRSPLALSLAAELVLDVSGEREAYAREKAAFAFALAAPDRLEGIAAFRGKRPPRFDW